MFQNSTVKINALRNSCEEMASCSSECVLTFLYASDNIEYVNKQFVSCIHFFWSYDIDFLQNELPKKLEDVPLATRIAMFFQHDGTPSHYTRHVMQHLSDTSPNRWIGRGSTINWPPRSPDLTPLDFCLWGLMKSDVYRKKSGYTRRTAHYHTGYYSLHKGTSRRTQSSNTPCLHTSCKVHWCWRWNFRTFIINCTNSVTWTINTGIRNSTM